MKYFKKVCLHDRVIMAVNADKEKYLNNEQITCVKTIGNVRVKCHDSEEFLWSTKNAIVLTLDVAK